MHCHQSGFAVLTACFVSASVAGQASLESEVARGPADGDAVATSAPLDVAPSLTLDPDAGVATSLNWSDAIPETGTVEEAWFEAERSVDFEHDFSLTMLHDVDTTAPAADAPNLAEAATNPVAALIQFQIQNNFNGRTIEGEGYSNSFVIQPVIPWKIKSQQMITRITLPLLVATADLGEDIGRKYGVGDTVAINFANFPIKNDVWGGVFAVGVGLTFPTASSDFLGAGKWQAGPGLFYINTSTPKLQWGGLVYQQWSYASAGGDGDRPEVSKLFLQPVLNIHFDKGWYTGLGDILWSIDWNNDAQWSIPLSVRLGKVTKFGRQPVNIFVEPFYNLMTPDSGGTEWGVKLSLTLLFPE